MGKCACPKGYAKLKRHLEGLSRVWHIIPRPDSHDEWMIVTKSLRKSNGKTSEQTYCVWNM